MIERANAADFSRMITHGAHAIAAAKQSINELNVFPVPDGDTGTNMSMTLQNASKELANKPPKSVGEAAAMTAAALLRGARGNSGVITSLLFRGFSKSVKELDTLDGAAFATALDTGVAAAYKAVMKPAEGTILTVSRMSAKRAAEAAGESSELEYVMEQTIAAGYEALAETVNQNPVLKKAGVVDAGAKGFLVILEGMLSGLRGEALPELSEEAPMEKKADFAAFETGEITFGYCTEFICSRDNSKDPEALRGFLSALGDSLVLVDDEEIIKAHVHTNHPGRVLEEALSYGALLTVKIENMREQHTSITNGAHESSVHQASFVTPNKRFGAVSVCVGEGMAALFRDLGVDEIISGGQTMNPSTEDILKAVQKVPAEVVYVLPNNKNIIMAAEQAVRICTDRQIVVIPTTSIPQGVSAMLAFNPEGGDEENLRDMSGAAGQVTTSQITYAARESDFDGFQIHEGDFLALAEGRLFNTNKRLMDLVEQLAKAEPQQMAEFITLYYGEDVSGEEANQAKLIIETACPNAEISLIDGGQPIYYFILAAE